MPPAIDPNALNKNLGAVTEHDYGYSYPANQDNAPMNLRPGSALHSKIVAEVIARAHESYTHMQRRHQAWNKIDETLTAFMSPDEEERAVKEKDGRKPISVVIPMSYAVLDTLVTYMVTTYLNEEILFKFNPVGPEDATKAFLMEQCISLQCWRMKVGLALHTMWRDSIAYGIGVTTPVWTRQMGKKRSSTPEGFYNMQGEFVKTGAKEKVEDYLQFEGNRLVNVDPYCYLPDPRVPAHEIQRAEYVGWLIRDNLMNLLNQEKANDKMFNVRYLKHTQGRSYIIADDKSRRDIYHVRPEYVSVYTKPVDVIYQYINLIPKDWGLGSSEYPEKWLFAVAADSIVILAEPANFDHGMYPVAVSVPDTDGYSVSPISRLEILSGMQTTIDWLISSHVTNIRKAINDMLIVDPMMINLEDLKDPRPGKIIRTRRPMWGKGVENAVKQLNVTDVTRNHVMDAQIITDIMQRVGAAPDSLQGIMRAGGERRSATESRDTRVSAFSRVDKMIMLGNLQAMADIGLIMASQTQQFMSQDTWIKIIGDWPKELQTEYGSAGMVKVSPNDINIPYDVRISDGSPASGEYVDSWLQLFQIAASNPTVWNSLDGVRMFQHIARLTGAKNIGDFMRKGGQIQPQVMPDEQVAAQAQAGNLVPIGQNNSGMMGGL